MFIAAFFLANSLLSMQEEAYSIQHLQKNACSNERSLEYERDTVRKIVEHYIPDITVSPEEYSLEWFINHERMRIYYQKPFFQSHASLDDINDITQALFKLLKTPFNEFRSWHHLLYNTDMLMVVAEWKYRSYKNIQRQRNILWTEVAATILWLQKHHTLAERSDFFSYNTSSDSEEYADDEYSSGNDYDSANNSSTTSSRMSSCESEADE